MEVVAIIPAYYDHQTQFMVKVDSQEMSALTGIHAGDLRRIGVGKVCDLAKLCSTLGQLRAKKDSLKLGASTLRAMAELMEAVAPTVALAMEVEDADEAQS
jgi:hypothetical protein